jgi:hypothetical protein
MKRLMLASCLAFATVPALADDFGIENPDQGAFHTVSKDLVDAFSYKALGPSEATGLTGFGIGGFATYLAIDDKAAWQSLTGEDVDQIGMAGVNVHKGLPFGIDLGAFYASVPASGGGIFGAEVRYAILEGGPVEPGIAIRGALTRSAGIDDVDLMTYSVDASISKGFLFLTPYIGAGYVFGKVQEKADDVDLDDETPDEGRVFVGLRIAAGFFEITPEYEHIGSNDVFNLRLGFSL